jgi:hypothetical protein
LGDGFGVGNNNLSSYQQSWPISTYGPALLPLRRDHNGDCRRDDSSNNNDDCDRCDESCVGLPCFVVEILACICCFCNPMSRNRGERGRWPGSRKHQNNNNDGSTTYNQEAGKDQSHHSNYSRYHNRKPRSCFNSIQPSHVAVWVLVALCSVLLLTSFTEEQFRLNPGETRPVRAPNPFFYRSVVEESWSAKSVSPQVGADVYYYADGGCPPLNGPVIHMESRHETNLGFGDYEYDYFYLNPGTIMSISLTVSSGSFGIYLLQGKDTFDSWAGGTDFVAQPLLNGYLTSSSSPQTFEYHIEHADVYYVGYDNPHNANNRGSMDIQIQATSYNLSQRHKIQSCHAVYPGSLRQHCCLSLDFAVFKDDCIIVQGTDSFASASSSSKETQVYFNDQNDVTIELRYERRWSSVVIVVCLVVLCFAVWCRPSEKETNNNTLAEDENAEITYAPVNSTPPPEYNPYSHYDDVPSPQPDSPSTPGMSSPQTQSDDNITPDYGDDEEDLPPPIPVVVATLVGDADDDARRPLPSAPSWRSTSEAGGRVGG